jgi:hypothetical protein
MQVLFSVGAFPRPVFKYLRQTFEERDLTRQNPASRRIERKPFRTVDFRKALQFARFRRPNHGEGIAPDCRSVAIAFERPCVNDLPAGLPDPAQRNEFSARFYANFLFEFALRGCKRLFVELNLTFGNRPGSQILIHPQRSTRVNQEHFRRIHLRGTPARATEHQEPRALFGHIPSIALPF